MSRMLRNWIWSSTRKMNMGGALLHWHSKSFLRQRGWFRSFSVKRSVDADGQPIPWWNYGVIDFVEGRLKNSMSVLEFGSGGSTTWLATRVRDVVSIENHAQWAAEVRRFVPANATIVQKADPTQLKEEDLPSGRAFDVMVVDPLAHRLNCAKAGLPFLSHQGVVVWDNTDGPDWPEIRDFMAGHQFREISFTGVAPQEVSTSRTTLFYRDENVFGI